MEASLSSSVVTSCVVIGRGIGSRSAALMCSAAVAAAAANKRKNICSNEMATSEMRAPSRANGGRVMKG